MNHTTCIARSRLLYPPLLAAVIVPMFWAASHARQASMGDTFPSATTSKTYTTITTGKSVRAGPAAEARQQAWNRSLPSRSSQCLRLRVVGHEPHHRANSPGLHRALSDNSQHLATEALVPLRSSSDRYPRRDARPALCRRYAPSQCLPSPARGSWPAGLGRGIVERKPARRWS